MINYCKKTILVDPYHLKAYNILGHIYRNLKEYEIAAKYYKKSISVNSIQTLSHANIGICYIKL